MLAYLTSCNLQGKEWMERVDLSSTVIRLKGVNRPGEEAGRKITGVTNMGKPSIRICMRMGL